MSKKAKERYYKDIKNTRTKNREYSQRYRDNNPENSKLAKRNWAKRNPESWKNSDPVKRREAKKRWFDKNPDYSRNRNYKRRLRIRTNGANEFIVRDRVYERDEGVCYLCGFGVDPDDWHLDHIISLANGGTNTYDNVAVTHPACNLKKGRKNSVR